MFYLLLISHFPTIVCQIKYLVGILLLNLKIVLRKQIIITNSCFVGYLLKVETFCCCRCLYFREQNYAALFDAPRSYIYCKNLNILP